MPAGTRHAPSDDESRIADVIRPVVAAAGMDLESVRVTPAAPGGCCGWWWTAIGA